MNKKNKETQLAIILILIILIISIIFFMAKPEDTGGNTLKMKLYDENMNEIPQKQSYAIVNGVPEVKFLNFEASIFNSGNVDFCAIEVWIVTPDGILTPIKKNILDGFQPYSKAPYYSEPTYFCADPQRAYSAGASMFTTDGLNIGARRIVTTNIMNIDNEILIGTSPIINSQFEFKVIGYYSDCCGTFPGSEFGISETCTVDHTPNCNDMVEYIITKQLTIERETAQLTISLN